MEVVYRCPRLTRYRSVRQARRCHSATVGHRPLAVPHRRLPLQPPPQPRRRGQLLSTQTGRLQNPQSAKEMQLCSIINLWQTSHLLLEVQVRSIITAISYS